MTSVPTRFYFMLQTLLALSSIIIPSNAQDTGNGIHTLMTKKELEDVFGRHHEKIPDYETAKVSLHHLRRRHLSEFQDNNFHLLAQVDTTNRSLTLQMRRHNSFISSTFKMIISYSNYTETIPSHKIPLPECLFHGQVESGGEAAISTCSQKGMVGLIIIENENYILQPLPQRLIMTEDTHIIYRKIDVHECPHKHDPTIAPPLTDTSGQNSTEDNLMSNEIPGTLRRPTRAAPTKVIEMAVFVDNIMYESIKKEFSNKPNDAIRDIIFTMINAVQLLYNQPSLGASFKIKLVRLQIIADSNGPDKVNGNIKNYLVNFCKWQSRLNTDSDNNPAHWDHSIIISGLDLYQDTPDNHKVIGLAWVSGMCRPIYSCSINEGNNFESVFVITHEMGHNLGMQHDGDGNSCNGKTNIMSPTLGPGKVKWSSCSKKYLHEFVKKQGSTCMNDVGSVKTDLDHERSGGLPGERFGVKEQCQKAFGNTFTPYQGSDKPFDNFCRELWCAYGRQAKRAHPALDGSWCANNKICKFGECVNDDRPSGAKRTPPTRG